MLALPARTMLLLTLVGLAATKVAVAARNSSTSGTTAETLADKSRISVSSAVEAAWRAAASTNDREDMILLRVVSFCWL